jgi:hypothetical protein
MSAGPSPTARRFTLPVAGATRRTAAPWSSATQIEPPPIQMLYAAEAPRAYLRVIRAVSGRIW